MKNRLYLKGRDAPHFFYEKLDAPTWLLEKVFLGFCVRTTKVKRDRILFLRPPDLSLMESPEEFESIYDHTIKVKFEEIKKSLAVREPFPWEILACKGAEEINLFLRRVLTTNWLIYREGSAVVNIYAFETMEIKGGLDTARQIARPETRDSFYQRVSVSLDIGFVPPELVPRMEKGW